MYLALLGYNVHHVCQSYILKKKCELMNQFSSLVKCVMVQSAIWIPKQGSKLLWTMLCKAFQIMLLKSLFLYIWYPTFTPELEYMYTIAISFVQLYFSRITPVIQKNVIIYRFEPKAARLLSKNTVHYSFMLCTICQNPDYYFGIGYEKRNCIRSCQKIYHF